jgi:acyl-CoA synthetase (NDP forming)
MRNVDRGAPAALELFEPLFEPGTIAVVGASAKGQGPGNDYIRNLRSFGFQGPVYPIHPTADSIEGLAAYRTLADTPEPVDYAYVAIGSEMVPSVLEAAGGRVAFAQVMSSGFGEVEGGADLQQRLVDAAHRGGLRLLGPNCLGTHSPRGHITFIDRAPTELGSVGVVAQSGGLGVDLLRSSGRRGLHFSGLVTVGNSADIGPNDLIDFYLADADTRVIGLYLEEAKDGRRLFEQLRANAAAKPVVILKGGRTRQGQRAAASHTGALAGDDRAWDALAKQTGSVLVEDLEQFVDVLLALQTLHLHEHQPTEDVVLFGNGGGTSVLATDGLDRRGFALTTLEPDTVRTLEDLRLPPGTSVVNPIDAPAGSLAADEGRIAEAVLAAVLDRQRPGAIVMHLNLPVIVSNTDPTVDVPGNLVSAALRACAGHLDETHLILVLRSDGDPGIEERKRRYRGQAHDAGAPVFDTLTEAAQALASVRTVERFRRAVWPQA